VVGVLLLSLNFDAQQRSIYNEQQATSLRVARDVSRYVGELRSDLSSYSLQVRSRVPRSQLIVLGQNLQTRNFPNLISLAVISRDGIERFRIVRLQAVPEADLLDRYQDPAVNSALRFGRISYSDIAFDGQGKASFLLTMPIRNDAGAVNGVLQAQISADPIIAELQAAANDTNSYAYLIGERANTALIESGGSDVPAPPQLTRLISTGSIVGEYIGLQSQLVVGARTPVIINNQGEQTGWQVIAEQPSADAFASVRRSVVLLTSLVVVVGLLALFWAFTQARRFLAPIEALRQGAAALGSGHLDHRVRDIADDELGEVAETFNQMATHLQESLAEIAEQNDRLRRGLALARDIQLGLLPDRPPWSGETIDVHAVSIPAYEVGGDFYTYLALSEGRGAIAIGDISGKGIGAALLMALTSSAVESQGRQIKHPAQVLGALNQLLAPRLKANHMNAALLFAVFDPSQAIVRVANAGMIAPILISQQGNQMIDIGGLPVGAFVGARYQEVEVPFTAGDTLLLLSDGVVEAHNPAGELFGFERLEQLVSGVSPRDARALVELVLTHVQKHMAGTEQHDDITIVAIRPQFAPVARQSQQEQAIDYAVI
jgi:serine phosphatase RsbU (regulator of sigma subunit)